MFKNRINKIRFIAKNVAAKGVAVAASGVMLIGQAHAALPAGVSDGFSEFGTDATALAGYAAVPLMLILGYSVGMKLTKRFANKI